MTAEIISVGTELLLGNILNTNAQYLSRELAALVSQSGGRAPSAITMAVWRILSTRQSSGATCWCSPAGWAPRRTT